MTATLTRTALKVGAWVQVRSNVNQYAGMIGPVEWIEPERLVKGINGSYPYAVDLDGPLFFSADELIILPGKPEGDPRLTRVVTIDGSDFLMIGLTEAELDMQELEIREI